MVKIDDNVPDGLLVEPGQHVLNQRTVAERHSRFGGETCQGIEPRAETGRKYEGRQHER
jgi:hypothetical protein